jgi:hypothetical protein
MSRAEQLALLLEEMTNDGLFEPETMADWAYHDDCARHLCEAAALLRTLANKEEI